MHVEGAAFLVAWLPLVAYLRHSKLHQLATEGTGSLDSLVLDLQCLNYTHLQQAHTV